MKNLLCLIFGLFFGLFTSGCAYNSVKADASNAPKCPETICKDCPDIEPYIEEHNRFWGSNSQMLYWASKTKESLYKRYDILCQDIIENFREDEFFIKAFKNDIKAFENYRNAQKQILFPKENGFGIMREYAEWSSDYSLTVQHIENLKEKVFTYCSYNSVFLKNESVCSNENIDKIFDKVKLKSPKPIISTPYDNSPGI